MFLLHVPPEVLPSSEGLATLEVAMQLLLLVWILTAELLMLMGIHFGPEFLATEAAGVLHLFVDPVLVPLNSLFCCE